MLVDATYFEKWIQNPTPRRLHKALRKLEKAIEHEYPHPASRIGLRLSLNLVQAMLLAGSEYITLTRQNPADAEQARRVLFSVLKPLPSRWAREFLTELDSSF